VARKPEVEVGECGVCGNWARGDYFVSGIRDLRTGETPCDNFVCWNCQREAEDVAIIDAALNQREKRRAA
jgi:hypothetical protein